MEPFEIAYDEETKQWVRRPCTHVREEPVPRVRHVPLCVVVIVTLQLMVAAWIFMRPYKDGIVN